MKKHTGRKVLAYATPVSVSTVITVVVLDAMPPHIAKPLSLTGLAIGVLFLAGWFEDAAALTLLFARPPTRAEREALAPATALVDEVILGPAVLKLRVQMLPPPNCWPVQPFARRTLLINPALIRDLEHRRIRADQAADHLARAALVIRSGMTRSDAFLTFWTVPWQILAGITDGVVNAFRGFPLTSFAWRARFITLGIAVVQAANDDWYWLAAFIAVIGILSYAAPAWIRRWDAALTAFGNHALAVAKTPRRLSTSAPHHRSPGPPRWVSTAAEDARKSPALGRQ